MGIERVTRRRALILTGAAVAAGPNVLASTASAQNLANSVEREKAREAIAKEYLGKDGEITPELNEKTEKILLHDHFDSFTVNRRRAGENVDTSQNPIDVWTSFVQKVRETVHKDALRENPLLAVKRAMEEQIIPNLKTYSKDATSVFDLLQRDKKGQNKLQCSSGSVAIMLVARKLLESDSTWKQSGNQLVFVYSDIHVQPGYIRTNPDGERELVIVESTSLGDAMNKYSFNNVEEFAKTNPSLLPLTIVDADHDLIHSVIGTKHYKGEFDARESIKSVIGALPSERVKQAAAMSAGAYGTSRDVSSPAVSPHSFSTGKMEVPKREERTNSDSAEPIFRRRTMIPPE